MIDDIDYAKLAAFLAGECSDAEADEVRQWLRASPDNARVFQDYERLWRAAPSAGVAWNADAAWSKVHDAFREQPRLMLARSQVPTPVIRPVRRPAFTRSRSWIAAAAAVLVVGGSALVLSRSASRLADHVQSLPLRDVATAKGQRASVRLSDGTRVSLGVDSKLSFAPVFGVAARDVYLEGEAFFDVTHDSKRPFVVHAGNSVTRVLGTKFGLRAYPGEPEVRVVVAEGRVRLRPALADSNQGVVLIRNQLGVLGSDERIGVRRDVDVRSYLGWMNGRMIFNDTPLREVLRELEHWYDVDLALADPGLDSLPFTAVFDREPLDIVVRTIARTLELRYKRTGSSVVFARYQRVDQ